MKAATLTLTLFTGLFLVACGGGGKSSSPAVSSIPAASSTSAVSSAASSVASSTSTVISAASSVASSTSTASSVASSSSTSSATPISSSTASSAASSAASSSTQSSAPLYSLGGSISGLDGSLNLHAGDQTLNISNNGSFSFPNSFQEGTHITLSLSNAPFRQNCTINSPIQLTLQTNISNISVSCSPLGVLTGIINNYHTGAPINRVQVTVTALNEDGDSLMNATALTDENGTFRIEGLGISARFVLNAQRDGFAARSEIFSNSAEQPNVEHSALVLSAHYSNSFSANSVASLIVDEQTLIELPANAFVTEGGNPASGTITPSLTIIDPSGDAGVMPGSYQARDPETGEISLIESFGALDASFRDAAGNLLQLAPGTSATISIPVASRITTETAPATIPLFYFDDARGFWVEEGEATLVQEGGQYFYRGTVTHFTTWNADRVYETVNLRGCVRDSSNKPLANARIIASGRDYIGQSTGYSDSTGAFVLPVRMGSSILLTSISGSQSDTVVIHSGSGDSIIETCLQLAESSATITLTWGENPRDLDSHWFVPDADADMEHQIYFSNKTEEVNGVVFDLDVDDTSSFGPEVVTVPDFPHAGTYRYVVRLFSGTGSIASSPARVELNLRGRIHVFSPALASGDNTKEYWHVFNIQVDASGNAAVVEVQKFSDGRYLDPVVSLAAVRSQKIGSAPSAIKPQEAIKKEATKKETKYYAK